MPEHENKNSNYPLGVGVNGFNSSPSAPKKRVLFIITQSELGGAQQFLLQFLKHLQRDAYDIHVAVGRDGNGSLLKKLGGLDARFSLIPSLRRNINLLADLKAITDIQELLRAHAPDTLFLLSSKAGFIGSLAARLSRQNPKVIYRIGGWTFNDPWPAWKKSIWRKLEKWSARWKDVIILNNARDLEDAKRLGISPRGSMVVVHNGIDPYRAGLSREEARHELSRLALGGREALLEAKNVIGTIANFYPAKGLEYLIAAAARNSDPDTIFCVIGDGAERPFLEKLIADDGLEKKVFLLGQIDHAARYLPAFDVFVLPSVKEGFPWSLLEAMAAKLPVIATRVGAVPEILEDGINGYVVEPRQPQQIAEKIDALLESGHKAQEMGIKAHQRVLFAFSITTMVTRIEELL